MKRRQMLIGLGMTSLTAPWLTARSATDTSATDGKPGKTKIVDLLYVQSARETTLKNGVLRLSTVNPSTLFFSDRPERIVGHEPIEDFVEEWGLGEDSFASNPPNAVLSILVGPKPQEITVVLNNPRLENADLVYDVKVLDGEKSAVGDASSLFIDVIGRPMSPGSVAGVHRRRRRRVIRRSGL